MRSGVRDHVRKRHAERVESVTCDVIGRTGDKIRLRAQGGDDLFDDAIAGLGVAVGDSVLVDVLFSDDDFETIAADVIGLPRPGIVEVRTRGELSKAGMMAVRRSPIVKRAT